MSDTPFKWSCIKCDKEIPQHLEYCAECGEKRYRRIGGMLYLPVLNMFLIAWGYFTALAITLKAGLGTLGQLTAAQSGYLFVAAGINFLLLLYIIYVASLFLRKKKEVPMGYSLLLVAGIVILLLDLIVSRYLFPTINVGYAQVMPIIMHIIYACIWIPYFRCSERVKKTFIR